MALHVLCISLSPDWLQRRVAIVFGALELLHNHPVKPLARQELLPKLLKNYACRILLVLMLEALLCVQKQILLLLVVLLFLIWLIVQEVFPHGAKHKSGIQGN